MPTPLAAGGRDAAGPRRPPRSPIPLCAHIRVFPAPVPDFTPVRVRWAAGATLCWFLLVLLFRDRPRVAAPSRTVWPCWAPSWAVGRTVGAGGRMSRARAEKGSCRWVLSEPQRFKDCSDLKTVAIQGREP